MNNNKNKNKRIITFSKNNQIIVKQDENLKEYFRESKIN